jgi:hypothetical protein
VATIFVRRSMVGVLSEWEGVSLMRFGWLSAFAFIGWLL